MKIGDRVISRTALGLIPEHHPYRMVDRVEEGEIGTIVQVEPDALPSEEWYAVRFDGHEQCRADHPIYPLEPLIGPALDVHLEVLEPTVERAMDGDR